MKFELIIHTLPLGMIGLYLRHALEETPAVQQHVEQLEQGDREGLAGCTNNMPTMIAMMINTPWFSL